MVGASKLLFAAEGLSPGVLIGVVAVVLLFAIVLAIIAFTYGGIWFRAYMSRANVSLGSLIGMSFRRVNANVIVQAKIMAVQAGTNQEQRDKILTFHNEMVSSIPPYCTSHGVQDLGIQCGRFSNESSKFCSSKNAQESHHSLSDSAHT